jgi:hypothetical protein
MPQIMPWWCPHTDLMFPTKALYRAHLRKLAATRYHKKRANLRWNEATLTTETPWGCGSFEEIAEWAEGHLGHLARAKRDMKQVERFNFLDWRRDHVFKKSTGEIKNFRFQEVRAVQRSGFPDHCMPEQHRESPGWLGQIRWSVTGPDCFLSEVMDILGMFAIYSRGGTGQKLSETSSASVMTFFMPAEEWCALNISKHLKMDPLRISALA